VLRWPIREGLLAYVEILKQDATDQYKLELLMYALGKMKKPPSLPRILKDG
jgi:hypothetical protein